MAAKNVTVTVTDNNVPGMLIEPATLTIVEEDDPGGSYTVVLTGKPSASVTVTIGGTSGTDITVSPSSLTFTTSNWNTAQNVRVTAAADDDRQPNDSATLTHTRVGRRLRRRVHRFAPGGGAGSGCDRLPRAAGVDPS